MKLLSIIVPFYNEEDNLPKLHVNIIAVLQKNNLPAEIVYVDDGCTDASVRNLKAEVRKSKKFSVKIISLRRNFGQTAATVAGINNSSGKILAFLDADLQNDPSDIPKLLKELTGETEVVVGWRKNRQDSPFHNFGTSVINLMINKLLKIPLHDTGCSLKVVYRDVINDLNLYGEFHRLMPIMLYWQGVKMQEIVVNHHSRISGESKYNYFKIVKFAIDLITIKFLYSYGTKPAYLFSILGFSALVLATIPIGITAYEKLFSGVYVHRNPLFLIGSFLVLIGVQFILMGLLAELLVRIYFETQNKPIYELKRKH